jgi:hypothetical protein
MLIGYGRVCTIEQRLALQVDALNRAGSEKLFADKAGGARAERPRSRRSVPSPAVPALSCGMRHCGFSRAFPPSLLDEPADYRRARGDGASASSS